MDVLQSAADPAGITPDEAAPNIQETLTQANAQTA
jgi:hypothetical protein